MLNATIEANMANEQFGVSELAEQMNMSRSNLLRKVKKETELSVSQLISQARLARGMELLKTTSLNVSEVSHQVGFNSPSYFIKCFREHYGFPPGEVGKREPDPLTTPTNETSANTQRSGNRQRNRIIFAGVLTIATIGIVFFLFRSVLSLSKAERRKSIAVLPFKNDSNDSSNIYLINGLMEATLANLQHIEELKVISRTTAEKYRNTKKSLPEIAEELNVDYFVEGSGQKMGDRIVLNIQLIDATCDTHLWAKQYRRETKEIFELQEEIARNIADEVEVIVTPEEEKRFAEKPTDNIVAYDYYLKGKDLFYKSGREDLEASIPFFEKAIKEDPTFALAYSTAAMVFYYLDMFQAEKKFAHRVSEFAEKAMLYNPRSSESLAAKALDFTNKQQYSDAVRYFEKAHLLAPDNGLVLHFLVEFYSVHIPTPSKHLKYALLKVKNDIPITDSSTAGFNYFHLSNALFETGFIDESMMYINRSLAYDSGGYFSRYFKVFVEYAKIDDAKKAKEALLHEWRRDSTRFDIMQEVAKMCFMMRDYDEAYAYYKKFVETRKMLRLDLYKHEDARIGKTYEKMGLAKESESLMRSYREYAENSQTIYKHLHLCTYYAATNAPEKALHHMKLFSLENEFHYAVLWLDEDPLMDPIKNHPEFKEAMTKIESKFWNAHHQMDAQLKNEQLP